MTLQVHGSEIGKKLKWDAGCRVGGWFDWKRGDCIHSWRGFGENEPEGDEARAGDGVRPNTDRRRVWPRRRGSQGVPERSVHDKNVKPKQGAAKQQCERFKERRNPSADAHGEPMSGRKPLFIVATWSWAITLKVVPNLMVICSPTAVPASQDEQGRLCSSLYLSSQDLG